MTIEEAQARIGVSVRDTDKKRFGVIQSVDADAGTAVLKTATSAPWDASISKLERMDWDNLR